ncbi:hypothetical protein EI42_04992 [Thermosporothrix hazakensis]|jgi:hypothetical protein|uniref:Uncharacterized protein n=2 Tax=Thermosporothrix TaxID=768650 RepID=A0A326U9K4_THEHA|nr:group-specific protein [Thermosporothrix hazakensis]PZW23609.1 hypothetical protein EI42_04992 [Thermosporothrix hazakensis]BBH86721.1 hypothetical protein KTC_14720 [Thermosporothrix sp. COM3]GCE51024.1 hypothetical protein KTH_58930 [Thermosporothrix hazakensis]
MPAIYHCCSPALQGDTLYPLNMLKELYPALYDREIQKYNDTPARKKLPSLRIPRLNCLWNDVIFCLPLHPYYIYHELQYRSIPVSPDKAFLRIPLEYIRDLPTAIYYDSIGPSPETILEEKVEWLDHSNYRELSTVPQQTLDWYDLLVQRKLQRGFFSGIPHILVKGAIPIQGLQVISWSDPTAIEQHNHL